MPKVAEYDIRKAVWEWILTKRKHLPGGKFRVARKPQWNFDIDEVETRDYFHQFFDNGQSKKRRLKRAKDAKTQALNRQFIGYKS